MPLIYQRRCYILEVKMAGRFSSEIWSYIQQMCESAESFTVILTRCWVSSRYFSSCCFSQSCFCVSIELRSENSCLSFGNLALWYINTIIQLDNQRQVLSCSLSSRFLYTIPQTIAYKNTKTPILFAESLIFLFYLLKRCGLYRDAFRLMTLVCVD